MADVVTIGETMALFSAPTIGRLGDMAELRLGVGGAESNVAIGLSRLGRTVAWIGRVGDDELGRLVSDTLRAEQVDISGAKVDAAASTALMLKEQRTADVSRVTYYRRNLAGSRLSPDDIDEAVIASCRLLHLTGITPGLSSTARTAVWHAIELASAADIPVSFDVNYRAALWSREDAAECLSAVIGHAAIVFAGEDELALIGGDPISVANRLVAGGAEVIMKLGERGAVAFTSEGSCECPAYLVQAIDPVGAGDGFVAGYLDALLQDRPVEERLQQACAVGAIVASTPGDWEGLPTRDDLQLVGHASGVTLR